MSICFNASEEQTRIVFPKFFYVSRVIWGYFKNEDYGSETSISNLDSDFGIEHESLHLEQATGDTDVTGLGSTGGIKTNRKSGPLRNDPFLKIMLSSEW
jgi:hypothetical protein